MMKLYGHVNRLASNTLKLRAALAEVGADYEYVPVDLAGGEQRRPEFLALNPHGKVPVLVDDDFVLAESDSILWYIGEKYPAAKLLPADARGRALVHQWCDLASQTLYTQSYQHFVYAAGPDASKHVPWLALQTRAALDRALDVVEQDLARSEYVAGALSIADFGVTSTLEQMKLRAPYDPLRFPRVAAYHKRMVARASWVDALKG